MSEFKFVLEFARHGAEASRVLYDFTAEGQENFPEKNQLTVLGAYQHFGLG